MFPSATDECQLLCILYTWYCQSFNFSQSSGCVGVPHCCFECPWMISNFHVLTGLYHLYLSLWSVCSSTLPIFIGLVFLSLSCKNSLYITDVNFLSDVCFANIFSPSAYLGEMYLSMRKIFSFDKVCVSIFSCYVVCAFYDTKFYKEG